MHHDTVLADLENRGFSLIEGDDGDPAADILEIAEVIGTWPDSLDHDLIGDRVMTIKFDGARAVAAERQAYFTCGAFPLHTDLAYIPVPPRWIVMQCVRPTNGEQGMTTLADGAIGAQRLSSAELNLLQSAHFRFAYPPGCRRGFSEYHPILEPKAEGYWVRFRGDILEAPFNTRGAVKALQLALDQTMQTVSLKKGDSLVIDNYRMLHGRTAFDPLESAGRTLLRTYAWS